jgi:hypothetical protein
MVLLILNSATSNTAKSADPYSERDRTTVYAPTT